MIPDMRTPIDVENYPDIDPETDWGKEGLCAIAYQLAQGATPIHFVFRKGGEEIGEMIVKSGFDDLVQ